MLDHIKLKFVYFLFSVIFLQLPAISSEHAHAPQAHHEIGPWQILVQSNLLHVLILAVAIIYLGNKFLPQMVDQRKKQISKEFEDVKLAKTKAYKELEDIKKKTQNANQEVEEIKQEARKTAEAIVVQMGHDTEKELEQLRLKIKREINTSWDETVQEIKTTTADTAFKLAEEALNRLSKDNETQKKLSSDFLVELEKVGKH